MDADPREARIAQLQQENTELQRENAYLRALVQQLAAKIEDLKTLAARQAAPFRRKEQDKKPPEQHRKPGRPAGHPGTYRPLPPQIDQQIEVPLTICPHCGADTPGLRRREQIIEELPPIRPETTRLITYSGCCPRCGRRIASQHPLQVSPAVGAAKVHLGPRALALAAQLSHQAGLTMRKVCDVLGTLTGLRLSPGGLSQALERIARKTADWLAAEQAALQRDPVVHSDETSWWLGRAGAWLWIFTNPWRTIYRIEGHRNRDVVLDVLGQQYAGVLVSDCLAVYENLPYRMHKCYAHHLKAIGEGLESLPPEQRGYLSDLQDILKGAMTLGRLREDLPREEWARCRQGLQQRAASLLACERINPIEQHVRNRLLKRLGHLFTFLDDPAVEPTNNRAERGLRPAVISRKLSCGNKTARGRQTWQTLRSLVVTCRQRQQDWAQTLRPYLLLPQPAAAR